MKKTLQTLIGNRYALTAVIALALLKPVAAPAQTAEDYQKLKALVEQMQKTIEAQNARIADLEKKAPASPAAPQAPTTPPAPGTPPSAMPGVSAATSASVRTVDKVAAGEKIGEQSQVQYRGALNDQQEAASRPKDYTLDPTYQGFIPIPNTPALIKFNAKPHLDVITDNMNAGSSHRFAPALFPLQGDPSFGGGAQSTVSANASQLRLDVRAPEMDGNFRFYYQNDFTGSDSSNMKYRLQHLYGQLYGFKAGFTYGVWEDPDVWPDTVDYEGPNAAIFSRRPVAQYTYAWNENLNTTLGVEQPDYFVDLSSGPSPGGVALKQTPDFGFNTRYEKADLGHLQFSTMFRDIGARDAAGDGQHVFGWGVNLGAGIEVTKCDSIQALGVYGHGVGGLGNDAGFFNSDAAFKSNGDLEALPYWSAMAGYTHRWNQYLRSTVSYGYVNLDNSSGQSGSFYHFSHYASANLVWQLRKRLSIGLEGLYGFKEAADGNDSGDHWRVQLGMVYSLFD